jgi:hypothetical protein
MTVPVALLGVTVAVNVTFFPVVVVETEAVNVT